MHTRDLLAEKSGEVMRFDCGPEQFDERRMDKEVRRFLDFTGRNHWKTQIELMDQGARGGKGVFYSRWLALRNPLLEPVRECMELFRRGLTIWRNKTPQLIRFVSRLFVLNRVLHYLSDAARERVRSALRGDSTTAFLFEVQIATHYLINKYDVEFVDLERTDRQVRSFDFLVRKDSFEGEVECVRVGVDAGRKVSREAFYLLCDRIFPLMKQHAGCHVVHVRCDKRLVKTSERLDEVACEVMHGLESGSGQRRIDDVEIDIRSVDRDAPLTTEAEGISLMKPYSEGIHHVALISSKDRCSTIVIACESATKNEVLQAIHRSLKRSVPQFSGTLPALLSCFVEGVGEEAWIQLREGSGLANMTGHFLSGSGCDHVNLITYTSEGEVRRLPGRWSCSSRCLLFSHEAPKFPVPDGVFIDRSETESPKP